MFVVIEEIEQILPKDLNLILFETNIKWFLVDSYKFGEIAITEDTLKEMISKGDIYAYAYAMYKSINPQNNIDPWTYALSFRIVFGVIEKTKNAIQNWIRTNYNNAIEISSISTVSDAPQMQLQTLHKPILWLYKSEEVCSECKGILVSFNNTNVICTNKDCPNFKIPYIRKTPVCACDARVGLCGETGAARLLDTGRSGPRTLQKKDHSYRHVHILGTETSSPISLHQRW